MGSIHAAYILMAMLLRIIGAALVSSGRLADVVLLNLKKVRSRRVDLRGDRMCVYLHIDDLLVAGRCRSAANTLRDFLVVCFVRAGFIVTTSDPFETMRYVGYRPSVSPARWTPEDKKLGLMHRGIEEFLYMDFVEVNQVRCLLAQFMWSALLWRPALSFPDRIFRWCADCAGMTMRLPRVIRQELILMKDMLIFIYADLALQPGDVVLSQDAAGGDGKVLANGRPFFGAFCIAAALPPAPEVKMVLSHVENAGRKSYVPDQLGSLPRVLQEAPFTPTVPRSWIPRSWCSATVPWTRLLARCWQALIGIAEGELRSTVVWTRVLAGAPWARRREFLDLGDNQSSVSCIAHGRSGVGTNNRQMRVLAANEAIGQFRLRSTWVGTLYQPSDSGTRPNAEGDLEIGPVVWSRPRSVVMLFAGDAQMEHSFRAVDNNVECFCVQRGPF